jgi:hypothetical protein
MGINKREIFMKASAKLLVIAGVLSFTVAVFQAVVSLSPSWSLYFGAPAKIAANPLALFVTGEITAMFFVIFGLYAISGAGTKSQLPLLRTVLIIITGLYLLRGLSLIPQLLMVNKLMDSRRTIPVQALLSSAVSLVIGIIYLVGILGSWKKLSTRFKQQ